MIVIRLSWSEILHAALAGVLRRISALRRNREPADGATDEKPWEDDINGSIAEYATGKWRGQFWNAVEPVTTLPDVGKLQVRSKVKKGHRLVVKHSDKDHEVFISALVQLPNVTLCGWLMARDAKREEWLHEYNGRPPMFYVEDRHLKPMDTLKAMP